MFFMHRRRFGGPHRRCAVSQRVAGPIGARVVCGIGWKSGTPGYLSCASDKLLT